VETKEQLDFLGALGCDVMQGFHISRPLPVGQVTALLDAGLPQHPLRRVQAIASTPI